ncbi:MAG: choice-of-anchor D domain-containing protein [Planctomycetales bacterium]
MRSSIVIWAVVQISAALIATTAAAQAPPGTIQTVPGNGAVSFGDVRIGTTATDSITAFRNGSSVGGALSGTFPAASGVFAPTTTQAFGPIAANGAAAGATRNYTFTPTAHVTSTQNLTITSNLGNAPLNLSGTGVGPIYDSTPAPGSTLDFGTVDIGDSASLNLDVTNLSTEIGSADPLTDLTLLSATFSGPDAAAFSIVGFTDGMVLSELDVANFQVVFNASAPPGLKTAVLTILTDEGAALGQAGNSFTYDLQGFAQLAAPVPEPTSLALWAIGGLGMAFAARRRRHSTSQAA